MPTKAERNLKFSFPQPKRGPQHVIALEHIQQAYGDLTVYRDLNFNCAGLIFFRCVAALDDAAAQLQVALQREA